MRKSAASDKAVTKVPLLQTDHSPLGPLPRPGLYLYERRVHGASDAMAALFAAAAVYRWKAERLRRVEPPRWAGPVRVSDVLAELKLADAEPERT